MKYSFDQNVNAGYIYISDNKVKKTVPVNDHVICDLDASGMLCGIELLDIQKSEIEKISQNIQKSEFQYA